MRYDGNPQAFALWFFSQAALDDFALVEALATIPDGLTWDFARQALRERLAEEHRVLAAIRRFNFSAGTAPVRIEDELDLLEHKGLILAREHDQRAKALFGVLAA